MPPLDITGQTTGDVARTGPRLAASPYPVQAIFEIAGEWQRTRPAELSRGPTQGINWWTFVRLVHYWFDPSSGSAANETYWEVNQDTNSGQSELIAICLPIASPRTSGSGDSSGSDSNADWQNVLYPSYEVGQWVKCIFDPAGGVWRVMESCEQIVRFELIEPLSSFGQAKAHVFGPSHNGSSDSEVRPWRGTITVHDALGMASADTGTCGYAKRFADSRLWEVLSIGSRRSESSAS